MSDTATERRFRELLGPDAELIFIRGGYSEYYNTRKDKAPPMGGGSHNVNATGGECDNFRPFRGYHYIYAGGGASSGVNLRRLGAAAGATEVNGVTVVQVATLPGGGQVVVGWFRGCTAIAEFRSRPFAPKYVYGFRGPVDQAILLRPHERVERIPKGEKGAMGQSHFRYTRAASGRLELFGWMLKALKAIHKREAQGPSAAPEPTMTRVNASEGQGRGLTLEQRKAVEAFAMARAMEHFGTYYDNVADVHQQAPYDLLCANRKGRVKLRVEVKGTTGDASKLIVTRGEVNSARAHPTAMFIASELTWADKPAARLNSRGWRQDVVELWVPAAHDLEPTVFEWHNPAFRRERR